MVSLFFVQNPYIFILMHTKKGEMDMYDLSKIQAGDLFICKAEGKQPNDFSLFAQVLKNEPAKKRVTIARYMKFGQLYCEDVVFDYSTMYEYYELASEEEKKMFTPKHPFYGM